MRFAMLVLPVDRNRILGLHQRIDQFDLFLTGMSRNMDVLEDHLRALHFQLVDDLRHRFLVARNRVAGKNNRIIGTDGHLAVHAGSHTAQRRHILSLAARRDDDRPVVRIILEPVDIHQRILRNADTVQVHRRLNDIDHAAPFHNHLSSILMRGIDDLLHPVHIGGKGRDNQPRTLMIVENRVKRLAHRALRLGKTLALRIGGITHQRQNALFPQFRKALQVNGLAVHRRIIHFEIPRMDHGSGRRMDGQGSGIHNAVVGLDKLNPKLSQIHGLPEFNHLALRMPQQIVLL